MTLKTRKPTGVPSWPMILLAGVEKSGKSWLCAEFSASKMVDRTFVAEIGEGAVDMYGAMPGARFEMLEHDGSFRDIGTQIKEAIAEPANGKPHCIVVDSVTEIWDLLCNEQQHIANQRAERKGRKGDEDATITMDQWNTAKKRWRALLDLLRSHNGPVILTARFDESTVMVDGKPSTDKVWKVRAEKNLPFEVDAIVEMRRPREYLLTGVRSLVLHVPPDGLQIPRFSIEGLLTDLGLPAKQMAPRNYTAPKPEALAEERKQTNAEENKKLEEKVRSKTEIRPREELPRNANGSINLTGCTKEEKRYYGIGEKNPEHEELAKMPTGDAHAVRSDGPVGVDELWQTPEPESAA